MNKYKVGDKVVVRNDLVLDKWYGRYFWTTSMDKFKGKIVTIEEELDSFYPGYHIKDMRGCAWTDEMFEGLAKDKTKIEESVVMEKLELIVGMELELKADLDCGIKVLPKGSKATIDKLNPATEIVNITMSGIGKGVFKIAEINEYFKAYVEAPKEIIYQGELGEGIKSIIQLGNQVCVILDNGTKGVAVCHNDDEFDFEVGKRVATIKAEIKDLKDKIDNLEDELLTY